MSENAERQARSDRGSGQKGAADHIERVIPAADRVRKERPTTSSVSSGRGSGQKGAADHIERELPAADQEERSGRR